MYSCVLEQLRRYVPGRVNSTREITLGFSGDIGATLHFTQSRDYDIEAMHLAKAAVLVKKELLYYIRNNALMVHLIPTVSGLQYLTYSLRWRNRFYKDHPSRTKVSKIGWA